MNLAGAFRVWLTVVACGVVAFGLAQTNRPDILWMDSSTDVPMDLAISPANDLIATIDHTVKLWRLQDGSLIRSLPSVPWYDHLTGVAFSPDGTLLAVAWNRGTVQLWNVADGSLVRNLRVQPTGNIITFYQRVVFSRDGSLLAASGTDGVISQNITVWRVATGEQLMNLTLEVPTYIGIKELQISPDGTLIAAAMRDGSVHLCRIPTGELVCTISAHAHEANSVDFTPDGAFLLTAGLDGVIRLWRVADGSLQRVVASGHFARLSPDGTLVAVTTRGGHTEIRRFEDGALLATIPTGGRPVFSPDGRLLTIARLPLAPPLYTPVQVWRVPEGTVAHQLPWLELQRFAYSSDGTKLAVLQGTRHPGVPTGYRIVLRNAADGSLIRTLELGQEIDWMWMQFVPNHDLIVVRAQRWSAAEQRYSTELRFLHTSDGTVVRTIQDASQVSFSADGTLMVAVRQTSAGERVQLLRMSDGAIVRELLTTNFGEYVNTAVLSPDARLVAM
ncbi:MAG: WD40 repeat domain-containing protein [Armatimonadota bacterium]|nr:WD40 repeat domain-containing protein [Armatimonadota bacterium]